MIDDKSDPGSWAKALAELGTHGPRVLKRYFCAHCQWTGDQPSITDASKEVERDGHIELDRVHRPVCPRCFNLLDGPPPAAPAPAEIDLAADCWDQLQAEQDKQAEIDAAKQAEIDAAKQAAAYVSNLRLDSECYHHLVGLIRANRNAPAGEVLDWFKGGRKS